MGAVSVNKVETGAETVDTLKLTGGFAREAGFTARGQRGGRSGTYSNRGTRGVRGGRGGPSRSSGPFCPGCYYLSQQLGATIHFRHSPGDCPRKAVTIKMLEMEDTEYFNDDE